MINLTQKKPRVAQGSDLEFLVRLINSAYRGASSQKGWTTEAELLGGQRTDLESLGRTLLEENSVLLLLEENQEIVACVYLQNRKSVAYLGMLTVKPTLQASGIGKHLLAAAEEWIKTNWNLDRIEMTVIQKRLELIRWYERRGYRQTFRREPFPYGDERFGLPKVDDLEFIVLEKRLSAGQHVS